MPNIQPLLLPIRYTEKKRASRELNFAQKCFERKIETEHLNQTFDNKMLILEKNKLKLLLVVYQLLNIPPSPQIQFSGDTTILFSEQLPSSQYLEKTVFNQVGGFLDQILREIFKFVEFDNNLLLEQTNKI